MKFLKIAGFVGLLLIAGCTSDIQRMASVQASGGSAFTQALTEEYRAFVAHEANEDYDRKALVLKDEERHNLEKDLETRSLEFKRKYEDFQRDLKRTDAELTSSIVEEIYEIVRDYGAKNNYSLVLEASSGALLYNDKTIDITDEIVKLHNASPHKEGSKRSSDKE